MNDTTAIQSLLDREAIRECIFRYCRGIDRIDEAALRASYWPDATDRHGPYQGTATQFIEAALPKLREGGRMIHHVGNLSIELRGLQAAVETYFLAWQRDRRADGSEHETFLAVATSTGSRSAATSGASPRGLSSTTGCSRWARRLLHPKANVSAHANRSARTSPTTPGTCCWPSWADWVIGPAMRAT